MLKDIAVGGAFQQFYIGLSDQDRIILYVLLAAAALIGLFIGRRRAGRKKGNRQVASWRLPRFQNPILQNYRHVLAVRAQLDFIPAEAVCSVVVFSGTAVFRTEVPPGVCSVERLVQFVSEHSKMIMSRDQLQLCVGRLETARLAISGLTDVEHVESLARRFGSNVG